MSDIESRLREFRPKRPAVIPDERLQRLRGPIWIAVAAAMAAVMLIATWIRGPRPESGQTLSSAARSAKENAPGSPTLGAMTTFALENPDQLDVTLTRLSGELLPQVYDALSPRPSKESQ